MTEWLTPAVLERVAQICRDAGAVIMPHFEAEGMAFDNKDDARKSQVTAADTEAEALILPALAAINPAIPIVAEEDVAAGNVPDVSGGEFWLSASTPRKLRRSIRSFAAAGRWAQSEMTVAPSASFNEASMVGLREMVSMEAMMCLGTSGRWKAWKADFRARR